MKREKISLITLQSEKRIKQEARECFAGKYDGHVRLQKMLDIEPIFKKGGIQYIDRLIKQKKDLTFEESLVGMCYVLAATNSRFFELFWRARHKADPMILREQALAAGTAFIQLMAAKEALCSLTPEEVAGMAAAGILDTLFHLDTLEITETCGMGGDLGFQKNGEIKKTINASTLSAIVISAVGVPAIKHGSYKNTSAIGSTEAIERFGACTTMRSQEEMWRIWKACRFCYFDAHLSKTIHDLSHLLMMETVNHIIGPMSLPVHAKTAVNKMIGVNEKIHPSVVAKAYTILHKRGIQRMGGVAVIGGLGEYCQNMDLSSAEAFRTHCILDEVSPFSSVVSLAHEDTFIGNFLLSPEDFGISVDPETIQLTNTEENIQEANSAALRDENPALADYLAMNAALGLFVRKFFPRHASPDGKRLDSSLLRSCYKDCRNAIASGRAWYKLIQYVHASGGTFRA